MFELSIEDVEWNRRKLDPQMSILDWTYNHWHYNQRRNLVFDGKFIKDQYRYDVKMFVDFLNSKCFPYNDDLEIKQISAGGCSYYPAIELTVQEFNSLSKVTVESFLNYRRVEIAKKPSYEEDSCSDMDNSEELLSERNTPKYREWRNMVLIRDGECQCCGHNKHLHVHHIFGFKKYPKLRYLEDNGITLCKWCHEKYHSIYGRKNPNPVTFGKYMQKYGVKS